jgi:hypothetical protein
MDKLNEAVYISPLEPVGLYWLKVTRYDELLCWPDPTCAARRVLVANQRAGFLFLPQSVPQRPITLSSKEVFGLFRLDRCGL